MTATTHRILTANHLITALATMVVSIGLAVAPTAAFASNNNSAAVSHLAGASPALCQLLAKATPGSPAAFRLAETIADAGESCSTPSDPPLCQLLAKATPGSPAAFRLAETIADAGESCPTPPIRHSAS